MPTKFLFHLPTEMLLKTWLVRRAVLITRSLRTLSPAARQDYFRSDKNHRLDAWVTAHEAQQRSCFSPNTEKVTVEYVGKIGQFCTLKMTKELSTPMDCARHLSTLLVEQSAIALIDGRPWSMFRPFVQDCTLDFLHFKDPHNDPTPANDAFWRSASFLLAATLESAFHPSHHVCLISNPPLKPESGGFVCDIAFTPTASMGLEPWLPSMEELRALSAHGQRLATSNLNYEPLSATQSLLETCFADQPTRLAEIRKEFSSTQMQEESSLGDEGFIYRMGSFIEASAGAPLISSTRLIGRFAVSSFLPLGWLRDHTPDTSRPVLVYRVQGVALPTAFLTHFTTFDRLIQWSRQANTDVSEKPTYVVDF